MDGIINLSGTLIVWLQSLPGWFTDIAKFFSFLGAEEFYLMIAPAILWCWDASLGLRLGLYLMASASINSIFKLAFHGPRPYWVDARVAGLASETSFGVPSGHSQNAMIVWGTLAGYFRKLSWWIIAGLLIFFIGISRLILGVHFPHDVLVGWLLGGLLLWIFSKATQPIVNWVKKLSLKRQILIAFCCSLGFIIIGLIIQLCLSSYSVPLEWAEMAAEKIPDEPIAPLAFSGIISNAGAFFGLAVGALWLESVGGFQAHGQWWQLGARYLLGLVGVLILWFGLGEIFPRGEEFFPYVLRYLRYALVGCWIAGFAPFLFRKLKLAEGKNLSPES